MYNRRLKRYNRRSNPNTPSMFAGIDPKDPAEITYFKSASKARAYLIKNSDLLTTDENGVSDMDRLSDDIPEEKLLKEKMKDAQKVMDHADKRNLRRQVQSLNGKGKTKRKRQFTAEQILGYDKIIQQMNRLAIPIARYASWCGITDRVEVEELHVIACRILKEKCPEERDNLLLWDNEGCADNDKCKLELGEIAEIAEITEKAAPIYRQRANPLYLYGPGLDPPRRRKGPSRAELIEGIDLADLHKWEEVGGPDGESIRFRVDRYKSKVRLGQTRKVIRDKSEPAIGDTVLDLTLGAKAYKITRSGRQEVTLNREMISKYKNSFVYHARRVAAGKISPKAFLLKVEELLRIPRRQKKKKSKKLRKKRK